MSRILHIVCLDCPAPPNYGGAIDMFYKIKALYETGHQIILHYFNYRPQRTPKMVATYCSEIHAYERKSPLQSLPFSTPFIIQSRINKELVQRLNRNDHPVLLEGLHCSGIVPFLKNQHRVVLRMHNDEAAYYRQLAKTEKSFLKKLYFQWESHLLHRYQKRFNREVKLACLSETDWQNFERKYGYRQTFFLPCFLPWQQIKCLEGKGDYLLYHGNLTISENEEAARWLIENLANHLPQTLVIAGKGISKTLETTAARSSTIRLINNPPEDELNALIRDAHIHLLPSLNQTGVKLKLLNAVLNGRFCITNEEGAKGGGISEVLHINNTPEEWIATINELWPQTFSSMEIEKRKTVLDVYNNYRNALLLSERW